MFVVAYPPSEDLHQSTGYIIRLYFDGSCCEQTHMTCTHVLLEHSDIQREKSEMAEAMERQQVPSDDEPHGFW